jgi:CDP-diglyceride synthetase
MFVLVNLTKRQIHVGKIIRSLFVLAVFALVVVLVLVLVLVLLVLVLVCCVLCCDSFAHPFSYS